MAVDGETSLTRLYEICMRLGEGEVIDESLYDQLRLILGEGGQENQEHLLDILWLLGMLSCELKEPNLMMLRVGGGRGQLPRG